MSKGSKGEIQLDWIIAFFIFILFVSWSFQYYSTLFSQAGVPLDQVAEGISGVIIGNITNSVYDAPMSYDSPDETTSVMYAYHHWTSDGEANTTMVFNNASAQVPYKIDGSTLYWQPNVIQGGNNFTMRVSNRSASARNCTGTFDTANANLTIPHAGDLKIMLSQAAIDSLSAINYSEFKSKNLINRDFRLSFEVAGGSTTAYGAIPPNRTNVFSEERWYKIEETNGDAKVTTLVW